MNRTILAAVSLLGMFAGTAAFAGQDQYPEGPARMIMSGRTAVDTGSEAEPNFAGNAGGTVSNVARHDVGSDAIAVFDGQQAAFPDGSTRLARR